MIESLSISNYALIDEIELQFSSGLNIITGETGAGKSIMLGALSMLFGNRADTKVVTDKAKKSVVEATFDISGYDTLRPIFSANDIDWDDRQLIMRREITPSGRSRSFVNDVPVSLAVLREIAVQLVDIHSQHQNLLLSTPRYQLDIIDTLLPDSGVKQQYAEAYEQYRAALKKYQVTKRALETSRAEEEYFRFQLSKLDELNLVEGEREQLEQERETLSNITSIKMSLSRLAVIFSEGEENILSMLRTAQGEISSLASLREAESLDSRIDSLYIETADIADMIGTLDSRLEANPSRLEYVENRLSEIYELQHKFGVESETGLIAMQSDLRTKIDAIDNGDERLRMYAAKAKAAKKKALDSAAALSEARKLVAQSFMSELKANAIPLGMKNLVFEVDFRETELTPSGIDDVTFLFAFNKNQALMPVKDTASGGEISRLMLTIKAIVADKIQLPSIIFDEIDTGVSGDVATRMGMLMKDISRRIQVIAITHLPQVASCGTTHFKVFKQDSDTATNTRVKLLDESRRIDELALMISGDPSNPAARDTAISLLSSNNDTNK